MPSKKPRSKSRKKPVVPCPFNPKQERAVDCPYEGQCPWHVREDGEKCFCAVGESPELQMRKMLARNLPRE